MSKLLALLVSPLAQVLGLLAVAILLLLVGWSRRALLLLLLATSWLWLCSSAWFADSLMASLERDYPPRALGTVAAADAIVLLGGGTRGDTSVYGLVDLNQHADRLLYAQQLYRAGKAPVILLSGGADPADPPEAQQMQQVLLVMGVPKQALLLEQRSRTTYENALYSAPILRRRGIDRILLVTSAFHMRRAEAVFRHQGIAVIPAPTDYQNLVYSRVVPGWLPSVNDLSRTTLALRERVGYWVYGWRQQL